MADIHSQDVKVSKEASEVVVGNEQDESVQQNTVPTIQTNTADQPSEVSKDPKSDVQTSNPPTGQQNSPVQNKLQDDLQNYFEKYQVLETKASSSALMKPPASQKHSDNNLHETPSPQNKGDEGKEMLSTELPVQYSEARLTENDSNLDQEELYRYCQLSSKLTNALSKIESSKISTYSQEPGKNFEEMHKRFEYHQKKRREELERKQKQLEEERLRQFKGKPQLSKGTLNIVQKINNQPIYERYQRELERKEQKLKEQRDRKKKQEEEEYQQYLKEFEEHNQIPEKHRTALEFYQDLVKWKAKKEEKVKDKKEHDKDKEVQGATFKPLLNQRSMKILTKTPRQPIYERDPKPPKQPAEQYTFKPKINKRSTKV